MSINVMALRVVDYDPSRTVAGQVKIKVTSVICWCGSDSSDAEGVWLAPRDRFIYACSNGHEVTIESNLVGVG